MSWLSQLSGVNINLAHPEKDSVSGATIPPVLAQKVEAVVNELLVKYGAAEDVEAADALMTAELEKL